MKSFLVVIIISRRPVSPSVSFSGRLMIGNNIIIVEMGHCQCLQTCPERTLRNGRRSVASAQTRVPYLSRRPLPLFPLLCLSHNV